MPRKRLRWRVKPWTVTLSLSCYHSKSRSRLDAPCWRGRHHATCALTRSRSPQGTRPDADDGGAACTSGGRRGQAGAAARGGRESLRRRDHHAGAAVDGDAAAWKVTANGMSNPQNLFASKDELALCTTYTCGLWTLFHSLTVSDVKSGSQWKPSEIMAAIRLVVKHFFGCEECKRHFLKANPEIIIDKLALRDDDGPHAVTSWIWTMHNTVNKVLGKPMWPTRLSCPNCYTANDQPLSLDPAQLNEEDIVAYIRSVYKIEGSLKLEQQAASATSWISAGSFTSMATIALLFAIFAMLIQQNKHRLFAVKALKDRDHIA
ncbi:hypothetical protein ON010_g10799 [Phytophthora cinnamomi]|nr:hypothetical protein ON010_g10799 [Phytophthora cinnamomi]